jgi:alpha-glucoside transport system permease protein
VTSDESLVVLRNNVGWVAVVTSLTVGLGMTIAVGSELSPYPRIVRSVVFMPMAISAVGASVIWQLVYAFKPAGVAQIGLLNQIITAVGGSPQAFFVNQPWNNFFLMWIMVWIWTGFPTVVFAAALRTVPDDLIEAAQIDGASGRQIFGRIILPHLRKTVVVVFVATVATVLKVFDIIRVSTNGQFDTNVVANEMINQAFRLRSTGRGAALAVLLFLLILPVIVFNAREFRSTWE